MDDPAQRNTIAYDDNATMRALTVHCNCLLLALIVCRFHAGIIPIWTPTVSVRSLRLCLATFRSRDHVAIQERLAIRVANDRPQRHVVRWVAQETQQHIPLLDGVRPSDSVRAVHRFRAFYLAHLATLHLRGFRQFENPLWNSRARLQNNIRNTI